MQVAPRRREHMLMLPKNSARCNILNILKQAAKWSSHFETGVCREWADQWPTMQGAATHSDILYDILAELSPAVKTVQ